MEDEDIDDGRRNALKMSGTAAAALFGLGSVNTVSAHSTNDGATSESEKEQAAQKFENAFNNEISVDKVVPPEETAVDEEAPPEETAVSSGVLDPEELVSPQATSSQFDDSVTGHGLLGSDMYRFSHSLYWTFEYGHIQGHNSAVYGDSLDPLDSYEGPGPKKSVEFSHDFSAVRVLRQGVFKQGATGFKVKYRPIIELGGDAIGYGFLVKKDGNGPGD